MPPIVSKTEPQPADPMAAEHSANQTPFEVQTQRVQMQLRLTFEQYFNQLANALASYLKSKGAVAGITNLKQAHELAMELMSELYIETMKSAHRYDGNRSARLWINGIGYNVAKRELHRRAEQLGQEQLVTDMPPVRVNSETALRDFDQLAELADPDGLNSPLENQAAVEEFLTLVAPEEREIIELSILKKLDHQQIGHALNITPEASRQRLSRARKRLDSAARDYLREMGGRQ